MKTREIEDENQNVFRNWEHPDAVNSARRSNPIIVRAEIMHEQLLKKNIRSETLPPPPKNFADKILRQSQNSGAQPKSKKNSRQSHR